MARGEIQGSHSEQHRDATAARAWRITQRRSELEGELRAAVLRVLLVSVLYAIQLLHFNVFAERTAADVAFQRSATVLAVAWLLLSLLVAVALARHWFPPGLKYLTTACDLALLTAAAALGSGAHSPVVVVYFLVIAMAVLRSSLRLIWFATLGAMAGYWGLVGFTDASWFDAEHAVAPVEQAVKLVSLGATGIVLGQSVRAQRAVAARFADRQQFVEAMGAGSLPAAVPLRASEEVCR
jgi:hypothetical protein